MINFLLQTKDEINALAGLTSALTSNGSVGDIATSVGGSKNAVENNRLATPQETKRIEELGKTEEEKLFYQAAACALIKCSAEFADDDPNKALFLTLEELGDSEELKQYRDTLVDQKYTKTNMIYVGYHMQSVTYETIEKLFEYTTGNKISDFAANKNNEYSITTRAGGVLQVGFGVVEGVAGVAVASTCASVVGCVASGALIFSGADNAATGLSVVIDGKTYPTLGAKGLASLLNIQESDAELLYGFATGALTTNAGKKLLNSGVSSTGKLSAGEIDKIKAQLGSTGITPNGYKISNGADNIIAKVDLENPIVQSRINVQNGDSRTGWEHVIKRHFSEKTNASQFTVSQSELKIILQSNEVSKVPISRIINSADGPRYERIITLDRNIGIDKFSGKPTNTMTILTDGKGNLITTTPGVIK